MKALTLYQPWAQLVALGVKRFETRSWSTSHRGRLAIHAAKTMPPEARELARMLAMGPDELPLGAVVGVVFVVDVTPTERLTFGRMVGQHNGDTETAATEFLLGDFEAGRYAWTLAHARKLDEPVPARGFQRIWRLP